MNEYFGKYRGKVESGPDKKGRIQVSVPDVFGKSTLPWAEPCVPYAGPGVGFFAIPPPKADVWIEFVKGDPNWPVWSGCYWEHYDPPVSEASAEKKVLKTAVGTITLNDSESSGGITIETNKNPKLKIVMDSQGIELTNGNGATVKLSGNKVSINDPALTVE